MTNSLSGSGAIERISLCPYIQKLKAHKRCCGSLRHTLASIKFTHTPESLLALLHSSKAPPRVPCEFCIVTTSKSGNPANLTGDKGWAHEPYVIHRRSGRFQISIQEPQDALLSNPKSRKTKAMRKWRKLCEIQCSSSIISIQSYFRFTSQIIRS